MRVGCFTALLSQFPLEKVLEKLKGLKIDTVELGAGNYPGDPHCKLSMLENEKELKEFKKRLDDQGFSISALMFLRQAPLRFADQRKRLWQDGAQGAQCIAAS